MEHLNNQMKTVEIAMSSLEIRFLPFRIFPSAGIPAWNSTYHLLPQNQPFDFADVLCTEKTNRFVGVSFAIASNGQLESMNFVKRCQTDHVKYVNTQDRSMDAERYAGFGPAHRLEILWEIPSEPLTCTYASLTESFWISKKDDSDVFAPDNMYLFVGDLIDTANMLKLELAI